MTDYHDRIGAVIIGRNEGKRLKRCLESVRAQIKNVIYVDSDSTDGSPEYTHAAGIPVVQLDMRIPFCAGRARNEGFKRLIKEGPHIAYVQFIDGDCELSPGWVSFAADFLDREPAFAIVAGRRKEKFPKDSIYNLLCDIEWNTLIGETTSCGGDFMVRCDAFLSVDGFNPMVIAGEEPELCHRLTAKEWKLFRADHSMTLHDAAMTKFSQWWKRSIRCGHAYAQGYSLHWKDGRGFCRAQTLKIWFWAILLPIIILYATLNSIIFLLLLPLAYFSQFTRIAIRQSRDRMPLKESIIYAFFIVIAKWPQLVGQILYIKRKLFKNDLKILEYH